MSQEFKDSEKVLAQVSRGDKCNSVAGATVIEKPRRGFAPKMALPRGCQQKPCGPLVTCVSLHDFTTGSPERVTRGKAEVCMAQTGAAVSFIT